MPTSALKAQYTFTKSWIAIFFYSALCFTNNALSQTKNQPPIKPKLKIGRIIIDDPAFESFNNAVIKSTQDAIDYLVANQVVNQDQLELKTISSKPMLSQLELSSEQAFTKDGCDIIIGGYTSSQSMQLAMVSDRRKKLSFLLSSSPEDVRDKFKHSISLVNSDWQESASMLEFAVNHLKRNSLAIVFHGSKTPAFGLRMKENLEAMIPKKGAQLKIAIEAGKDLEQSKKVMDQVRASAPQLILCACTKEEASNLMAASSSMGLRYSVLTNSRSFDSSLFAALDEKASRGHFVQSQATTNMKDKSKPSNELPASAIIYRMGYEAVILLGNALSKSVNSLPATISKSIAATHDLLTLDNERISFHSATRSILRPMSVFKTLGTKNFEFQTEITPDSIKSL